MLPTPITPADALAGIVTPALGLLPCRMDTPPARVLLIAIALQESALTYRKQIGGPARGLWQAEQGGGYAGVLKHPATKDLAAWVCSSRDVAPNPTDVYYRIERDDILACAFARLLLWTDREPLPQLGHEWASWSYYLRTWRPGKPHAERWPANYDAAVAAVRASDA